MNYPETYYLCKKCKGCEAVADGEAECLCIQNENNYMEEY